MNIYIYFLSILLILSPLESRAFNWSKCRKEVPGGLLTSTTQFVSSWGVCSLIGKNAHDKKIFFAQNFEIFQTESSRGTGDYLNAFAILSGCNEIGSQRLKKSLQSNFEQVFGPNLKYKPKKAYDAIEGLLKGDPVLKKSCGLDSGNNSGYPLPLS